MRLKWLDIDQVLFLRVYGPRLPLGPSTRRKERGQYPVIVAAQAWPIKDLLHRKRELSSSGTQRLIPSGQDNAILPARVANHSAGFGSSGPLTELAI